ncbi:phytanoyl-CoA dioxygenase family protein [Siccirubricoccus sp. KC 17139]|uniref:Phytanoyl-CoA dioxygenase family protein n=1 Tax=Siccirubricoccus soli TaxID=2899147 RepID=A0ABT1DAH8_9PROT|nr:phytanoyl-CoA dioxygenase family protein [Siccirubricoccus soli]MCO6418946.1 phytanoyl-CoA dioxygenase family protein [Siccirubricoccus soli]MCP2685081.1 phytanoyl-CoA dioxygenase family protein [Siccirubricoccus soli]
MPKLLTEAQLEAYRRDGYVTPFRAVSAAEAERWRQEMARTTTAFDLAYPKPPGQRQSSSRVKPYLLFRWAAEMVRHPAVLDAVEDVIGPDILVYHTTLWWKEAGTDGFVPWHQDGTYFGLAPHEHVTAWVALTPSTEDSGCVTMLPGSHKHGQLPHTDRSDPGIMLSRGQTVKAEIDASQCVPIPLQPGEFSLHDTMVLHASSPNRSKMDRIGLGISYIPARCYHTGPTRLSATLVRGENRFDHFDLEPAPQADFDAAAVVAHRDSVGRFFRASQLMPEMSLVH